MQSNLKIAVLTIIIAFMLTIIHLPEWAINFRPDWVSLVIIYWAMALPDKIGVNVAWFAGLMLDISHGAIIGQHALGLVIVIYIVNLQHQKLRVGSLFQQSIIILFLLLLNQTLVLWVYGIVGNTPETNLYFMPSLVGAVLWPWVYFILRDLRRKFIYRSM